MSDSVRVLGRLLVAARAVLPSPRETEKKFFRNRVRAAKRLARALAQRLRSKKGQKQPEHKAKTLYRQLLKVVRQTLQQVHWVESRLRQAGNPRALFLAESFAHYVPLVERVIAQTTRRVLEQGRVAARDKIVSLFEPHTAIIQRGKPPPNETEFGRKLWYSEVDGGLISEYRVLRANPPDAAQWLGSLKHHRHVFGHLPEVATADRGVFSPGECGGSTSPRRQTRGTATSGREERSAETARSAAVVQSGVALSQWD